MAGDAPDLFCFVNSGYDERPIAPRKVCMDLLSLPDFEVSPDELLQDFMTRSRRMECFMNFR